MPRDTAFSSAVTYCDADVTSLFGEEVLPSEKEQVTVRRNRSSSLEHAGSNPRREAIRHRLTQVETERYTQTEQNTVLLLSQELCRLMETEQQAPTSPRPDRRFNGKKKESLGPEQKSRRQRLQHKTRRDAGSTRNMSRDDDLLRFLAEQSFVRFDSIGERLAPGHTPAVASPPPEQLANPASPAKRPWPADHRHRMMAVSRLLRKLERRGYVEVLQPWADQPAWARVTAAGLHHLGLGWQEVPWPDTLEKIEARLRHDRDFKSHHHLINQVRLLLMRGGANAPEGVWKGERDLEIVIQQREGQRRPHRPDGLWHVLTDGFWNLTAGGTVLDTIPMYAGQTIAIEVECSRKSDARLADILPDLLVRADFVWYFCLHKQIRDALVEARDTALETDSQRRRLRIMLLEKYLCL